MPTLPKPVVTDEVSPAGTSFGLVLLGGPREGSDTACTVPEVMLIWRIGLINISPTGFDHEPGKTGMTSGTPSGPQVAAERGGRPEEPGSCAQSAGRSHVVVSELRVMGSSSPLTSVPVALARDSQGPGGFASGRRFAKAREACERVRGIATERAGLLTPNRAMPSDEGTKSQVAASPSNCPTTVPCNSTASEPEVGGRARRCAGGMSGGPTPL